MTTNGETTGLRGTSPQLDYVTSKRPVISGLGATRTLTERESGSTVLFDRAAGIVITLPAAKPGISYEFVSNVTCATANIVTNITTTTPVIIGAVTVVPDLTGTASVFANKGSAYSIAMNGGTTGGIVGSRLTMTALSSGTWMVSGITVGTGSIATPFV